jgi:hypothetical protein
MTLSPYQQIRQRATQAVIRNSVLSWQTVLTVSVSVLLFLFAGDSVSFDFWQPWFWLIGGGLAEIAWVVASVTDPQAIRAMVVRELERKVDLNSIQNEVSRQRIRDAMEYRNSMFDLVGQHQGAMRMSLSQTVDDVENWIAHMYSLAQHIDTLDANELVERDRRAVPQQIDNTKKRIQQEDDPQVRADLERKLMQLEQQRSNLDATVQGMKRAEIQLESTLASLGTIYAQMSLIGTKDVDNARTQRLRLEIQDEVAGLQDTLDAIDDVQSQSLRVKG